MNVQRNVKAVLDKLRTLFDETQAWAAGEKKKGLVSM